ncbi:hypothetical protein H6G76_34485 [Nostoc sp. FACHB-152]|uniref:hypothetical protein n=1 Tax=Nostoc sp. FACHB-152 TaxID=2692837 RepID=UPI001684CE06|nr:hypothetical protein [Nostoc sp. FACHB-152]MBD2452127.1 hypothetical protein [Nostoc sp. FACHB-152]
MNKLFATFNILMFLLPSTAIASNINEDLSFFETNNNLIIALDNKTNTACSFNTKTNSVVKMSGVKFTNTRIVGASYWWGKLSGNLNHFLEPKTWKIKEIKGKWSDNNVMLIKLQHYKDYADYTQNLGPTCIKQGGLNEVAKKMRR